ncbi:hypothetical protein SGFS_035140 [Streptomyces graminofaciens]|uniref:Integral membrane protein n=1 Tax=Streptomyces graminofaciens TaxID=68212 RepID=A0ABM7F8E4_9ACTN|nr:hypothetical protein [Streptomyces graminofaciens]BBC32220.1 hypothetical protein SGFS_035140 [Streptomyces graminofaciens]
MRSRDDIAVHERDGSGSARRGGRHSPAARALLRRWPTALALALTLPGLITGIVSEGSGTAGDAVGVHGEILPLLPLLYVIVHQAGKPRVTWPLLGGSLVVVFGLLAQEVVSPSGVLVGVALVVLLWGALRGTPHGRAVFGVQAVGAVVFCALALVGLAVDPDLGRFVVAAGWLFHGVWDFVHLRARRLEGVVAPSFAEWCGVVDVVVAVELLFLP